MNEFADKLVLVTGGSRGIGKAVALRLAREGARVAITYRHNARAAVEAVAEMEALGGKAYAYQNDGGDFAAVKALVGTVKRELGEIQYLVNNAGIGINKSFFRMTEQEWDEVLQANLKSVFNFCRHLMVDFLKAKRGSIVNVSSVAGFKGLAGQANYCASKAGIINLTRSLAQEFGRTGIRVNCVAPGYIDTDMTKEIGENLVQQFLNQIPCRSFGEASDVAEAVLFLLSAKSRYILGETIVVDGGLSL